MVKGITYILKNDSGVQALVTENKAGDKYKVYPNICPYPEKFPYCVVRQTARIPIECKGMEPTTFTYRYDVMSFEQSYENCELLNGAVVTALSLPDGGDFNGVHFQEIRNTNTIDQYSTDYNLHVKISSFEAMVDENTPT